MNKENEKKNEIRPSTQKSQETFHGGSKVSLRSIFSKKKISPVIADVVYMTEELENAMEDFTASASIKEKKKEKRFRCFDKLISKFKDALATKYIDNKKQDSEEVIKKRIKELFIYIIFLILLIIISFGMCTPVLYYYTSRLRDNILNFKFQDNSGSFTTIGSMDDFWKYLEFPLLQSLFWNTWYNQIKNSSNIYKDIVYFEDKLVGVPRLRQLRVEDNSCTVPSFFQESIKKCYDQYSDKYSNKTAFRFGNATAWIYTNPEAGSEYSYTGQLATYESGGFMQLLTRDQPSSYAIIENLKNNKWLAHSSRVVFIDYTIYNANIDLFCVIKLVIEFPPTGGAFPTLEIRSLKLLRYVSSFDYFIMFCEILYVIFILYYILEEMIELKRHGIRYLIDIWNMIDLFVISISFSCILLNVYRCLLANTKLDSLLQSQDQYPNFDFASYWQKIYNETVCINVFLSWFKIFKYINFSKTITQFTTTIARSKKDLIGFTIMFLLVFFAFSVWGYLLFSSQIVEYRKFEHAIFALFRIILGDFTFSDFYNANNILGPLFFISYIFFVFFILLSMFIAIVSDSFIEVKNELAQIKEDHHVATFFKKEILNRLRKKKIVKIQEVLENSDIMKVEELSFQDWRRELLKHGYAEVEIQALFMKYDHDGDRVLDYDERNRMMKDIKEKNLTLMDEIEIEDDCSSIKSEGTEYVTRELMDDLICRIDNNESGLFNIIIMLDKVFEKLAESEKAKLNHHKKVRSVLALLQDSKINFKKLNEI